MRRAVIVGGGISGLSAAYHLSKAGIPSTIIESRPQLGGVIRTERVEGCVIEAGPDSFLAQKPWALELIRDVGLGGDVIPSNDHLRKTYVLKRDRLIALPDGLLFMVPTKVLPLAATRLLGPVTKLRMGLEWFRRAPAQALPDRSVAEFVEDHYGREAVEYLTEPLLAGVYGGDPGKLSIISVLPRFAELETRYGSLTKGVLHARKAVAAQAGSLPLFQTLKGGLEQLVDAVVARTGSALEVITGRVEALEPGWRVRVNGEWIEAGSVVVATEAHQAAALLGWQELADVPYSSSMTVALAYDRRTFRQKPKGFGFLVPLRERRNLVACTFVGTKFSHRVPEDKLLLRCFMGGALNEAVLGESAEWVIAQVREELRTILGVTEEPLFWRIARWPRSMAQYTVGHQQRMKQVEERLRQTPGLYLAGNGYYGIGIPDCVRMGKQAAEKICALPA